MTKAELIHALTEGELTSVPDDAVVIMAKGGEGNSFSPLSEFGLPLFYHPQNSYQGSVSTHKEDDGITALVLWPVN
jgi:hypothetical protein